VDCAAAACPATGAAPPSTTAAAPPTSCRPSGPTIPAHRPPARGRPRRRPGHWLHSVLDPDRVEATVEHLGTSGQSPLAEDRRRHAITARIEEAGQRLSQFEAALAQGADPGVVSAWINEAQADLARARTDLTLLNNEVPAELSHSDLTTVVTDMSRWSAACRRRHRPPRPTPTATSAYA
jgi:hypothetical protein